MKNFDIFLILPQNIDCGYTLERLGEAVLTSTHNLCFGAKVRNRSKTVTETPYEDKC